MAAEDEEGIDLFYDALEDPDPVTSTASAHSGETATQHAATSLDSWPLHRAAFDGDVHGLQQLLSSSTSQQLDQPDLHGNLPLHVAALAGQSGAVEALLAAGAAPGARSQRGWTPLEEALAGRHNSTAALLLAAAEEARRLKRKAERAALLDSMTALPDYSMQVRWQLGSSIPGLGALLRRYAPHDTLTIWKVGRQLRMDGSLMGLDTKSSSLLPEWKRGHYSLILDGSSTSPGSTTTPSRTSSTGGSTGRQDPQQQQQQPATSGSSGGAGSPLSAAPRQLFVNHTKSSYIDLGADKKALKADREAAGDKDAELAAALEEALSKDVDRVRVKARDVAFQPVAGWLGGTAGEKVEGWPCALWEVGARLVAVNTSKAHLALPPGATWGEYLAAHYQEDTVQETPIDPFNPAGMAPGSRGTPSGTPAKLARAPSSSSSSSRAHSEEGGSGGSSRGRQTPGPGDPPDAAGAAADEEPEDCGQEEDEDEDEEEEDWLAPDGGEGEAAGQAAPGGRRLKARCWMCSTFPMSLSQLLPLLEMAGSTIPALSKAAAFLQRVPPALADSFPVKMQVPLLFTVHATVSFKHFQQLGPAAASLEEWEATQQQAASSGLAKLPSRGAAWAAGLLRRTETIPPPLPPAPPPAWFQVPPGYSRKLLAEVAEKSGFMKAIGSSKRDSMNSSSGNGGSSKWDLDGDVEF